MKWRERVKFVFSAISSCTPLTVSGLPTRGKAVLADDVAVDGAGIEVLRQCSRPVIPDRAEKRAVQLTTVFRGFKVFVDEPYCTRMHRDITDLVALTLNAEVLDALAGLDIAHAQSAELFAADAVIEQGSENGLIP
jgi:hypothetical protein